MKLFKRLLTPLIALAALAGSASAPAQLEAPVHPPALPVAPPIQAHPALWKVSDHDTTIYLFGTIHLLPPGIDWLNGPLAYALDHSDTLMTELPDLPPGDVAAALLRHGTLPADQNLRQLMNEKQRGQFEAELTALGLPLSIFDRKKAWVAAATLPILQLQKAGYNLESGAENSLTKRATQLGKARGGLETADFQFGQFDVLSDAQQLEYLGAVLDALPQITPRFPRWSAAGRAAMRARWRRNSTPTATARCWPKP